MFSNFGWLEPFRKIDSMVLLNKISNSIVSVGSLLKPSNRVQHIFCTSCSAEMILGYTSIVISSTISNIDSRKVEYFGNLPYFLLRNKGFINICDNLFP